jgi:cytidylate kinase
MIIAIDGPAGSGKSTISAALAARLGYQLIDTGALYRCVALAARRLAVSLQDDATLGAVASRVRVRFQMDDGVNRVFLDDEDVSAAIRTAENGDAASRVSAVPSVRTALLEVQREMGRRENSVMEGRDIGTVVFPDAEVKIYLTASADERARRRWEEFGGDPTLGEVKVQLADRDARDMGRKTAPLKCAEDAVELDSTNLGIDAVVERIEMIVLERLSHR